MRIKGLSVWTWLVLGPLMACQSESGVHINTSGDGNSTSPVLNKCGCPESDPMGEKIFGMDVRFADQVTYSRPETWEQFGPDLALCPPSGLGPTQGSLRVFNLGEGEFADFSLKGHRITNGPGIDFRVFENTFHQGQKGPDGEYLFGWDLGFVQVSQNGDTWVDLPYSYNDGASGFRVDNRVGKSGLVGLGTVQANCAETSPLDLQNDPAGGDGFDLETIGLAWVKYIRLIDGGALLPDGLEGLSNGLDIDSVAIFYPEPE